MKYELMKDRFGHKKGTIVYDQSTPDYGSAGKDTIKTGELHLSVTLNSDGDYPGFTVAFKDLKII